MLWARVGKQVRYGSLAAADSCARREQAYCCPAVAIRDPLNVRPQAELSGPLNRAMLRLQARCCRRCANRRERGMAGVHRHALVLWLLGLDREAGGFPREETRDQAVEFTRPMSSRDAAARQVPKASAPGLALSRRANSGRSRCSHHGRHRQPTMTGGVVAAA